MNLQNNQEYLTTLIKTDLSTILRYMGKNRDRSQLKFRLLLLIKDSPLGISKYMLKKQLNIATTKQIDGLLTELLEGQYIVVDFINSKSNYRLSEKGVDFIEKAEIYFLEFLGIDDY